MSTTESSKSEPLKDYLSREEVIETYGPYIWSFNTEEMCFHGSFKHPIVGYPDVRIRKEFDTQDKAFEALVESLRDLPKRLREAAEDFFEKYPELLAEIEGKGSPE